MTARRARGPVQLAEFLGLERFRVERAVRSGDIPAPDRSGGRWSADVADELFTRAHAIAEAAGYVPDYGAVRMAQELARLLEVEIWADGVEELARRGLLPATGCFKGHTVYDGRAAEAFTDAQAAVDAQRAGELRTAEESAGYLRIRRADLDHLTRAGLLAPSRYGRGPLDRKDGASVPLYRTGDLDDLTARADVDWDAIRQARKGQRSPLAALPTAEAGNAGGAATATPGAPAGSAS
jgi:hypothetical protein